MLFAQWFPISSAIYSRLGGREGPTFAISNMELKSPDPAKFGDPYYLIARLPGSMKSRLMVDIRKVDQADNAYVAFIDLKKDYKSNTMFYVDKTNPTHLRLVTLDTEEKETYLTASMPMDYPRFPMTFAQHWANPRVGQEDLGLTYSDAGYKIAGDNSNQQLTHEKVTFGICGCALSREGGGAQCGKFTWGQQLYLQTINPTRVVGASECSPVDLVLEPVQR